MGSQDTTQPGLLISIDTVAASDGWGFVGRVMVADHEAYRTLRSFPSPSEALSFTQKVVGDVLGALLAGQEWRTLHEQLGHVPLREDLNFGLSGLKKRAEADHD